MGFKNIKFNKIFGKTGKFKKPSYDVFYTFVFNFILLSLTLIVGGYYINTKLLEIDQKKTEQQNMIKEKSEFVKNFTKLIQSRIYLSENYYQNVRAREKEDILSRSWENYMNAVKLWSEENLLNPIFIKYYFGDEMQHEFYNEVQPKLFNLHYALLEIRDGKEVENIEEIVEEAKHEAFIFSEKLMFNGL